MAQTGSAQREPSMEEILASIRRIIEDSDAVRTPDEEADAQAMSAADTHQLDAQPSEQNEVAAFRAELDEPAAEILTSPFGMSGVEQSVEPEPKSSVLKTAEIHPLRSEALPLEPVAHASPLDGDIVSEELETAAPVSAELSAIEENKPSIISEQTGRQVAAAFGELSEAFAANRKRSFDEMAEDMMRPMLQDWLDNNLPTLVERLVREEIERVARGS